MSICGLTEKSEHFHSAHTDYSFFGCLEQNQGERESFYNKVLLFL